MMKKLKEIVTILAIRSAILFSRIKVSYKLGWMIKNKAMCWLTKALQIDTNKIITNIEKLIH